jgi:hypothetical protein
MTDFVVETLRYRLELGPDGTLATVASPAGESWASLRLLAALDTAEGPDETLSVEAPRVVAPGVVEIERRSTRWERAAVRLTCTADGVEVVADVRGRGRLTDVHLLGGRSLMPGGPTGFLPSGSSFRTLFSPNPGDPGRLVRAAAETAVIGVSGDGQPGRGHWFFTPAPLSLWLTTAQVGEPVAVDEGWLGMSIAAPVDRLTFVQLAYVAADRSFSLRLEYEGHTRVDGEFATPTVVLAPGIADPYTGLRRHRADLAARGAAPEPAQRDRPDWWSAPIFCGWGAQNRLARVNGGHAAAFATQVDYDGFLGHLEREGVVPGTIVIDDKWQAGYGTNEPDPEKWPNLPGWIADRHARGQRVLLWWKAWDPEGLPPELCIRNAEGAALAVDPTNPVTRDVVARGVARLLAPDGLDADGLKIDFTARTPSGSALSVHGSGWGIALLHELLAVVHRAAKDAKPDALLITQTPHPGFVDVTDMIRLNDMLRLDDPGPMPPIVPQMRYRAEVARAACPELLIDTDDWCVPSLAEWREYLAAKKSLGVPSLYYADALDLTGEAFEAEDYEALRRAWA